MTQKIVNNKITYYNYTKNVLTVMNKYVVL